MPLQWYGVVQNHRQHLVKLVSKEKGPRRLSIANQRKGNCFELSQLIIHLNPAKAD